MLQTQCNCALKALTLQVKSIAFKFSRTTHRNAQVMLESSEMIVFPLHLYRFRLS